MNIVGGRGGGGGRCEFGVGLESGDQEILSSKSWWCVFTSLVFSRHPITTSTVYSWNWGWWWGTHSSWPFHRTGWDLLAWRWGCWVARNSQVRIFVEGGGMLKKFHAIGKEIWKATILQTSVSPVDFWNCSSGLGISYNGIWVRMGSEGSNYSKQWCRASNSCSLRDKQ